MALYDVPMMPLCFNICISLFTSPSCNCWWSTRCDNTVHLQIHTHSYQSESRMSICRQNKLTLEIGAANPPHLYHCNQQKTQTIPYPPLASLHSLVHGSSQFTYCCAYPAARPNHLLWRIFVFCTSQSDELNTKDRRSTRMLGDILLWFLGPIDTMTIRSAFAKVDGRIVAGASCRHMNSLA